MGPAEDNAIAMFIHGSHPCESQKFSQRDRPLYWSDFQVNAETRRRA